MWRVSNSNRSLQCARIIISSNGGGQFGNDRGTVVQIPRREFAILVARAVRSALKLRYLLLGGAAAGGISLHQVSRYKEMSERKLPKDK